MGRQKLAQRESRLHCGIMSRVFSYFLKNSFRTLAPYASFSPAFVRLFAVMHTFPQLLVLAPRSTTIVVVEFPKVFLSLSLQIQ